ncbi:MAG: hypothetical protein ABIG44_13805 [Planctomycetota bacterium]
MSPGTGEPSEPNVQDSDLECPHCTYNLTGLSEYRCPECGEPFDPDELARLSGREAVPTTPWELLGGFAGFWETWALAAFRPTELARRFPRRHNSEAAMSYSMACYACAAGVFLLLESLITVAIPDALPHICCPIFSVSFGAVMTAWACGAAVAGVLALLVQPKHAHERYHFWYGITNYTSGFLILTGAWGGVVGVALAASFEVFGPASESVVTVCLGLAAVAIFFWWCGALWSIVWSRGRRESHRFLACLAIPIIGAGAIFLGAFLTALFVSRLSM